MTHNPTKKQAANFEKTARYTLMAINPNGTRELCYGPASPLSILDEAMWKTADGYKVLIFDAAGLDRYYQEQQTSHLEMITTSQRDLGFEARIRPYACRHISEAALRFTPAKPTTK